ncbi:unnamed protein product [Zymoseptoria tritici ST99CH_1A5]|nr:unnamed protein product [Zymoseptoria tritici ST99CH_1E4]SMR57386.1 unnamed protein product [Zymoseptoria tritici ST99CH_3D1]SMY25826.1 unnamed protein product [Zymoseptoria tritici ST99CH_1A5]
MGAKFTVHSGSERVVVFPDRSERTSSSGSVRRSRISSRSLSSEESWSEIDEIEEDDIEPSDSASRSRHPTAASRRHTVEARPAPSRHSSSRHSSSRRPERVEREEPPPRRHSTRHTQPVRRESAHRPHRSSSHRVPSDESSSTVASADDYHYYGHPRAGHPPPSGYRHVPAPSHGGHSGYPPSMTSGGGQYQDPYAPPHQALVHMHRQHDPFGYPPAANPFSHASPQQNPFAPMRAEESGGYFPAEPMGPPPPRQRPQSFAAAPTHYGSEMMAPYHPPPGMPPYGAYPGMPGYPPYGYPGHAWSPPPPKAASPPPKEPAPPPPPPPPPVPDPAIKEIQELLKAKTKADDSTSAANSDEIKRLKDALEEYKASKAKIEQAWLAEKEADIAAKKAEKERAEEEKRRKQELDDARKKAKEDAEDKAKAEAKKAKEEHEKKLAEVEKAKTDSEAAKKALEEEIAKAKPTPDSQKPPIKFKDAIGRKFSFPFALCKTWQGMEKLIKQAFMHIDQIGDQVHAGHYDLTGPDGEIILPQVWDTVIQPDWEITMHMWPVEEKPSHEDIIDPFSAFGMFPGEGHMQDPHSKKPKPPKDKAGKKNKKPASPEIVNVMPGPPGGGPYGDPFAGLSGGLPPGFAMDMGGPPKKDKKKSAPKRGKEISGLAAWLAGGNLGARTGGGSSKKGDEKLEAGVSRVVSDGSVSTGGGASVVSSEGKRRSSRAGVARTGTGDSGVVIMDAGSTKQRKSATNGGAAAKKADDAACVVM